MSDHFDCPRILIVTAEIACVPGGREGRSKFTDTHQGELAGSLGELIDGLYDRGADIHLAQPDYRHIFRLFHQEQEIFAGKKIPDDRIHLAEDRTFFYSNQSDLNDGRENVKTSIAFQREVINQIIPRVQPDLIHCHDWMTGLIPAVARKLEQYIDIYEKMLQRPVIQPERKIGRQLSKKNRFKRRQNEV